MKLRRKNEYLETLFETMNSISGGESYKDETKNELQIQTGGGDIKAFFGNLLKSINEFTDKWSRKSSIDHKCEQTKIDNGKINITLDTNLTTYFP